MLLVIACSQGGCEMLLKKDLRLVCRFKKTASWDILVIDLMQDL
jgi:hypothetical protein